MPLCSPGHREENQHDRCVEPREGQVETPPERRTHDDAGQGDDDPDRAGHQQQSATDRQHKARAEERQLHRHGDSDAVGFERAVAIRRVAE